MQKRMFKVISPVERRDGGGKWWMRCGIAYVNKDESINIYLEALPLLGSSKGDGVTLQLREFTAEELREREQKKASYQARTTAYDPNGPSGFGSGSPGPLSSPGAYPRTGDTANDVPF